MTRIFAATDPNLRQAEPLLRRRQVLVLGAAALLGACTPPDAPDIQSPPTPTRLTGLPEFDPDLIYASMPDERFPLDGADLREVDEQFLRTIAEAPAGFAPGTIVIDTSDRFLYLVQSGGSAIRYGVGVGRQGASWRGRARVGRKAMWPGWTPTATMIRNDPEKNGPWAGGMQGGPDNPLGARALYLYDGSRDTMYRIHGTNEPWSIGQNVSSGCIRLINHDIIDLHARVPEGTTVVVRN
ncbi:MAG: L,D-transpeptidase [Bosea sp. (in: a-proteobacteria)]